ncbi:Pyruvate/Phosphoenolpyruvate kinase-like domain-containing protein [Hyaloscypha sp. PMI_1271]|nr:Pyruvate/Phosphoenolpyruvate kinase-like domain-containing protein [Hyaloscypha sp. PMI_1271]
MTDQGYLEQPDIHAKAPFRAALLTQPGNLREALRQAVEDPTKTLFGVGHGIPSTFVTKLIASTKPDFIWIDVEHGMFNRLTLHDAIHAAQHHSEGKSMVIVRVPKHDEISLTTALDAGAAGIVIPHCESAEEVKQVLEEAYYPPIGKRSFSPWTFTPGITDTSLYKGDPFNMGTSNRHTAVFAQIESVKGVENVDEIAALEGISGLMFGPGDYLADAGLPIKLGGEPHPIFADAFGKFVAAGMKHGKPLMGAALAPEMIPGMIQQGFRAIAVAFDVWGFANLVDGGIKKGREFAQQVGEANGVAEVNGKAKVDGKAKANGLANGTELSSKIESDVVVVPNN